MATLSPQRETHPAAHAQVLDFGCRLNTAEGELIRKMPQVANDPNLVVINSCAVTAEAERQARQQIRQAHRLNPQARIVVTGCAAQINPAPWARMPEVALVLGNIEKLDPESFKTRLQRNDKIVVGDIMAVTETSGHLASGFADRARAFVEIQQGCNHRCTYCIIPFGRGNARSAPQNLIQERIRHVLSRGIHEVVLTGVDITSYGTDLPDTPTLGQLVQRILKEVPDLPRLRLSSIDVAEVDTALLDCIADEPRLMPHLHLSLQSGDDMILKRMKRRHTAAQAVHLAQQVRRLRPDIVLGADLIAGFPTESESMFQNSLAHIAEVGLVHLHVFPYSERKDTPAAKMPAVPIEIRRARAEALRRLGATQLHSYLLTQMGVETDVLVERANGDGHTPQFAKARVRGEAMPGTIVRARISGADNAQLLADSVA